MVIDTTHISKRNFMNNFMVIIFSVVSLSSLVMVLSSIGVLNGRTGVTMNCKIEYKDIGIPFVGDKWVTFSGTGIKGKLNPKTGNFKLKLIFSDNKIKYSGQTQIEEFTGDQIKFNGGNISGNANLTMNTMKIHIEADVWGRN